MILPFENACPCLDESVFVASNAAVIGRVTLGAESSVWWSATLRGDINEIVVGPQSNVQDQAVLHVADDFRCVLGQKVTVGHGAVVHACEVADEVLIGMGAIILDGARIGPRSIIAAGALVTGGMDIPEGSLVMGSPARVKRTLPLAEQRQVAHWAEKYVRLSRQYLEEGVGA